MNILVVGRGGREQSLVMHLSKSERVDHVFVAPGNGGMEQLATCVPIDELAVDDLAQFAKESKIDLTIVGPESSLNAGIANRFHEEGLAIFAPTKEAALLEGSKDFAKAFMVRHNIPTAAYATFTDADEAIAYIKEKGAPIVIKADGLAEGKGVVVALTETEAIEAVEMMMVDLTFADAGTTIVIEEFLAGKEFSLMAFVDGHNVYPMLPARDHKRAYDGDEGPNTGGMGAFAPVPDVTEAILDFTTEHVLQKTADSLVEEGRSFTGILYAGLMQTNEGTKVIEFNTRFGDPETQIVLPLLENDLVDVFLDVLAGEDPKLAWRDEACVGVVVASKGYPGEYTKGVSLPSLEPTNDAFVIQAGTKQTDQGIISNGGRVLLVGGVGANLNEAAEEAYGYLTVFDETDAFFYRKDIGKM